MPDSQRRHTLRRTKIVATIGPASCSKEMLRKLINNGIDCARLNFSHGSHEEHKNTLTLLRELSLETGRYVAILQDLCGPKIRISTLENGGIQLKNGAKIRLCYGEDTSGDLDCLYIKAFNPAEVMNPGEKALLADGRIELVAEKVDSDGVTCQVTAGGHLRSRSGIAVPDSDLDLPCLTDKDKIDAKWAVENNLDYIALSFVGRASDVRELRQLIKEEGGDQHIIAKIERSLALDNVGEIIDASDGVMVARGDLGLELPLERVPSAQKLIIDAASARSKVVITATQMLQSMVTEIRPTRAEVSDVYTAVQDGTDAVMLSEETAIGEHPDEVVNVFTRILLEAEKQMFLGSPNPRKSSSNWPTVADAVCSAAANAGSNLSAAAIVSCTASGSSARLLAHYRPQQKIFGATSVEKTLTRMAIYWGVTPIIVELGEGANRDEEIREALKAVRDQAGIKPGSRVVVTSGMHAKRTGSTNLLEIREIPRD